MNAIFVLHIAIPAAGWARRHAQSNAKRIAKCIAKRIGKRIGKRMAKTTNSLMGGHPQPKMPQSTRQTMTFIF
jgi:hypothetical protein